MRKRTLTTAAVAAALVGALGFAAPPAFATGYGSVSASTSGDTVSIGNDAISRTFNIAGNKLKTGVIDNKLGNTQLTPGDGSEEFYIEGLAEQVRQEPESALTSVKPPVGATVSSVSEWANEPSATGNAIDGNPDSYWSSAEVADGQPWFVLDFGAEKTFNKIIYTPRISNASYQCTGQIYAMKVQKWDGSKWVDVKTFNLQKGADAGKYTLELGADVTTSKLRLEVTDSYYWKTDMAGKVANIAEIDVQDAKGKSVIEKVADADKWTAEVSTNATNEGQGAAGLIDGDASTYWHSNYGTGTGTANKLPADVTIDRGTATTAFQTVGYLPRPTSANGNWKKVEIYASDEKGTNGEKLFTDANKLKSADGSTTFDVSYAGMYGSGDEAGAKWIYLGLEKACDKRYVGIRVIDGQGEKFAAGAEIDLFSEQFTSVPSVKASSIKASDLTLTGAPTIEDTNATINGEPKHGKLITFNFQPVDFGNGKVTVAQKVVMYDGDHYMRKWLEIESTDKDARFSFIDGEHLNVKGAKNTWTIPTDKGGVVSMTAERSILGQPFYAEGMFFGSEFPETDTQIVSDNDARLGRARYWTGKNFTDFERDNQLTTDGKYVSWQTVCGASHSDGSNMNVIQADFFSYIESIAKPSEFRIQYNSWFDNMMFIDDENILDSFKAVDKHLNETGVRPLDSYVVDDGWNNYRPTADALQGADDIRRNGEGVNTDGFWTFNSKFPDGLTPSSNLVQKLGSNFGVWIGPRGGYNYYGQLAGIIQAAGNGSAAGGSIDVADQRYVTKFQEMAQTWMQDYGVNYWKWDGFADSGQYNAFQQGEGVVGYDENHHHMYGGPNGYYHVTDLWEKWIVLFENVWKTADQEQIKDLWISLTCYVNPSPWFLQWSSSVWIQCVGDRGEVHNGTLNDKMNSMLTYRDACYYDFIKSHEFQFPLANLYNHDPIYGKEGTGITVDSMNGEEFRNYLYMMGTRGTAFWELYYSDSLFDTEKYLINADFLKWEEENFNMLRNAKWIGGKPSAAASLSSSPTVSEDGSAQEAYGFSGWNTTGDEGIVSMRNPATTEKTIEFTLDAGIGCTSDGEYKMVIDHSYAEDGQKVTAAPKSTFKKGEKITMTLQPGETQIWHFSKDGDTTAPELTKLSAEDNTTLRVQVSEHVSDAAFEVTVNGEQVKLADDAVRAYADLKTFDITLPAAYADGAKVEVKAAAGKDAAGNKLSGSISRAAYANGVIASSATVSNPAISAADRSVTGHDGFAATATVKDAVAGQTILSQGDQWSLAINAEGYATFTMNGVTATSDVKLSGTSSVAGVRENNGMLKVYVNGEVAGSAYDEKNVSYDVTAAKIEANKAAGTLSNVTVYDYALGYDEVPGSPLDELVKKAEAYKQFASADSWTKAGMDELIAAAKAALEGDDAAAIQAAYDKLFAGYMSLIPGEAEQTVSNLAKGTTPTAAWVDPNEKAEVTNTGSPLTNATDGVIDLKSYAIFGNEKEGIKKPAYMQIDLGKEATIESVDLTRYYEDSRTYGATALVVSNTEDFSEKTVLYYSSDDKNTDVFELGEKPTADLYVETKDGKRVYGNEGDEAVQARYIRLYGNGVKSSGNIENHILELAVNGYFKTELTDPYNLEDLKSLISRAETALKGADAYTDDSVAALKDALAAAKEVVKTIEAEAEKGEYTKPLSYVEEARTALAGALEGLVQKDEPVDPDKPTDPDTPNPPVTPGDPDNNGGNNGGNGGNTNNTKPGSGSNGNLPHTGDNTVVAVAGVALAAVACTAAGVAVKRRR